MHTRLAGILAALTMFGLTGAAGAEAATCTPTGFTRDAINLTAALINPTPAQIPQALDATGCDIGIYINSGNRTVEGKDVFGAKYFGIAVNGDESAVTVNIRNSFIHNIGEKPFNGSQHGDAIYVRAFFAANVIGEITGNSIFGYQKSGIVANGRGVKLSNITNNRIFGLGHVAFIAQNGIQVGYGAMPAPSHILGNTVSGNSYIGSPGDGSSSTGILVVGGPGFGLCPDNAPCPYSKTVLIGYNATTNAIGPNFLFNNDVGVYLANIQENGASSGTPTNVLVVANLMGDDICYNPYQAGISAQGNADYFYYNYVLQGGGYTQPCGYGIDTYDSINVQSGGNNVPPGSSLLTAGAAARPGASAGGAGVAVPQKP